MMEHNLTTSSVQTPTPYQSGYLANKIYIDHSLSHYMKQLVEDTLRSVVFSFNWLAMANRPHIATITNTLAQYLHCAAPGYELKIIKHPDWLKFSFLAPNLISPLFVLHRHK